MWMAVFDERNTGAATKIIYLQLLGRDKYTSVNLQIIRSIIWLLSEPDYHNYDKN